MAGDFFHVGLLFMHSNSLIIHGTSAEGFERAFRLFPLRTGTPNSEWIVLGADADKKSSGGVLGAG